MTLYWLIHVNADHTSDLQLGHQGTLHTNESTVSVLFYIITLCSYLDIQHSVTKMDWDRSKTCTDIKTNISCDTFVFKLIIY